MKKIAFVSAMLSMILAFTVRNVTAQIRELPEVVKEAFEEQYPDAQQVQYDDKLVYVLVHFNEDSSAATAKFTSKGAWQWTETEMKFTALPEAVQDGFNKSKYVDWQVDNVYLVDLPGKLVQYKLQVSRNAVQKKNLYFNKRGRLLSDNITLY